MSSSIIPPVTSNIPTRHRPLYDGLTTGEAMAAAAMAEYELLKKTDGDENDGGGSGSGLNFAYKTAMWIAYERHLESQRSASDRLFHDPLAQRLSEPYGQRLSDAMAFGLMVGVFDPPGASIGLGMEGHVVYTAARTRLVNDEIEGWLSDGGKGLKKQVVNVGAGVDSRPYWLDCLTNADSYWEIDAKSVMKYKQSRLDEMRKNGELLQQPKCTIRSISMDFAKQSIADLPTSYGFDASIPSVWILEGLIMYLNRADVEQLMDVISNLSPSSSYLILNFSTNMPATTSPSIDELDERLGASRWKKMKRLMFGEEGFHYNRYPVGGPANKIVGFAMYQKE